MPVLIAISSILLMLTPSPEAAVELTLGWHVSVAPGAVRVTVRVPRRPENRSLEIVVESPKYLASSTVQLDGETAPLVQQFWYKNLPAGSYEAMATVGRNDGSSAVDRLSFSVVGASPDGRGAP